VPPRREKAVLAHPRANLKGHFAGNGCERALRVFRGEGSFRPGKRRQEALAPVVCGRKPGEISAAWLLKDLFSKS